MAMLNALDGMPLALELAAAHSRLLSPAAMRRRVRYQGLHLWRLRMDLHPGQHGVELARPNRGQFSTRKDVVADGKLAAAKNVDDPLIDALVMAADQDNPSLVDELVRDRLAEP